MIGKIQSVKKLVVLANNANHPIILSNDEFQINFEINHLF